jgi:hypothetical protein
MRVRTTYPTTLPPSTATALPPHATTAATNPTSLTPPAITATQKSATG